MDTRTMICFMLAAILADVSDAFQNLKPIYIGGLFTDHTFESDGVMAFLAAIDYVNSRNDLIPNVTLRARFNVTPAEFGTFGAIQATCSLVREGVGVVIGPAASSEVKATAPILGALNIPQIAPVATDPSLSVNAVGYPYLFKMVPPDTYQAKALEDIISKYGWSSMSVIASADDYGQNGLHAFQENALKNNWVIRSLSYFVPKDNLTIVEIRHHLQLIQKKGSRIVIMNCLAEYARAILDQAKILGMTGVGWAWLVTDGVTSFSGLFDACTDVPGHLRGLIGTTISSDRGSLHGDFMDLWKKPNAQRNQEVYAKFVFDSVLVAAYAIHDLLATGLDYEAPNIDHLVCSHASVSSIWTQGSMLRNTMKNISGDGVTTNLKFTHLQTIDSVDYNIVNLRKNGWHKVGSWHSGENNKAVLNMDEPVYFSGNNASIPLDFARNLENVTLKIMLILEDPYVMLDEEAKENETKYKGFCIDLLNEIQEQLLFRYELYVVNDGTYGAYNRSSTKWNGLMGEMIQGKADLALGSFTITYEREKFIDFTKPFQDLGAIILMAKPTEESKLLGFLDPFSINLWIVTTAAFLVCGFVNVATSWLSPYGQRGRYSSRLNHASQRWKSTRNYFNLSNSLWTSFSQWMQQGTESSPPNVSGRWVYGVWYFVVMVISATYTANLAAFLTIQRLDSGINSLEDLSKQTSIAYGTVKDSAIAKFFDLQNADPYVTMSNFMKDKNSFVKNGKEGIKRVKESFGKTSSQEYAFIFDSAPLAYAESYGDCNIKTVGRVFNNLGYGIGLQKGSPYNELFSLEILKLRQSGFLSELNSRWVTSGPCSVQDSSSDDECMSQATLPEMTGVFFFLAAGLVLVIPIILCECCTAARRDKKLLNRRKKTTKKVTLHETMNRRFDAIVQDMQEQVLVCCGFHDSESDTTEEEEDNSDKASSHRDTGALDKNKMAFVNNSYNGHVSNGSAEIALSL